MTQFGDYIEPKKKKVNRDAANEQTAYIRGNQPQPRQNENNPRDYDQVKVENGSGYTADPFGVLRIHNASWPERTDSKFVNEGMRNGVESLGVKPSTEWDMVSVLQKSAPDSNFAQGVCSGPTPVFVLFRTRESLDYPFAIPISQDSSELIASPYGLNRILWHSEPSEDFQECTGEVLQAYVNMGEDGQWTFWKLKEDLTCCGSATGQLCDECGTVLQSDCPIERTIYAPKGLNLCGCENSCGTWKAGDIVPAWWFQYLGKWVTIPNFHAGLEEKEIEVVTGLQMTGGVITPSTDFVTVVKDLVIDTDKITLCDTTPTPIYCDSGTLSISATASGSVSVTGNIGTAQNPIKLDVVSACDDVTISNASLSSSSYLTLTGNLTGTAPVTVNLSGVEFAVLGTCAGTAVGNVNVAGTCEASGTCQITSTLPTLTVTGTVSATQNPITLSGARKTLSRITGFTAPSLALSNVPLPSMTGTVTGTLSNATTTNVNLTNVSIELDLSSVFEEVDAVDPESLAFDECELTWETMKVLALKSGADLAHVSARLTGTLPIPSTVTGTSVHEAQTGVYGVAGFSAGGLSWTDEAVTVPNAATLDTTKLSVTGSATFPSGTTLTGTCSTSGTCTASGSASLAVTGNVTGTATGDSSDTADGTATLNNPVSVSGMLSIPTGVTLRGTLARDCPQYARGVLEGVTLSSSGSVSLPVTGTVTDSRTCYVDIPSTLCFEEGAIEIEPVRIALPSVDLTGATITGTTTTIKYVACADCPEPEEDEEEEETPNA